MRAPTSANASMTASRPRRTRRGAQRSGERRLRSRFPAPGLTNRTTPATLPAGSTVLQERGGPPAPAPSDDLAPPDEHFAPTRGREAGAQADKADGGRSVWCERGRDTEVCIAAARRVWIAWYARAGPPNVAIGGHRVGPLILVPHARPPVGRRTTSSPRRAMAAGRSARRLVRPNERHGGSKWYSRRKASPRAGASARRSRVDRMWRPRSGRPDRAGAQSASKARYASIGGQTHTRFRSRRRRRPRGSPTATPCATASRRRGRRRASRVYGRSHASAMTSSSVCAHSWSRFLLRAASVLHLADLLADRDQGVGRSGPLFLRLALSGLVSSGCRDWERDRRRMEAVVR